MPRPEPMGAPQRHDCGAAGIGQLPRQNRIVAGIGMDDKAGTADYNASAGEETPGELSESF